MKAYPGLWKVSAEHPSSFFRERLIPCRTNGLFYIYRKPFYAILLLVLGFLYSEQTLAQGKWNVDSLKSLLLKPQPDSIKAVIYEKLSGWYMRQRDTIQLEKNAREFYRFSAGKLKQDPESVNEKKQLNSIYAASLLSLGNIHYVKQNFDSALWYYHHSLEFSEKHKDIPGKIRACFNIGRALRWKGKLDSALVYMKMADGWLVKYPDKHIKSENLNEIGVVFQKYERNEEALKYFEEAYQLKKELNDDYGQMKVLGNIGVVNERFGNYEVAKKVNRQLLDYYMTNGSEAEQALCFSRNGTMMQLTGSYDSSIYFHRQALILFNKYGDKNGIARTNNYLGITYKEKGDLNEALKYYHKSYEIYSALGIKNRMASSSYNIGTVFLAQGKYEQALEIFLQAEKLYREANDNKGISQCLGSIGILNYQSGNLAAAKIYLLKSMHLDSTFRFKREMALDLFYLGKVLQAENRYDSSLYYFQWSGQLWEQMGDSVQWINVLNDIGSLELRKNNFDRAVEIYSKSVDIGIHAGSVPVACYGLLGLAEALSLKAEIVADGAEKKRLISLAIEKAQVAWKQSEKTGIIKLKLEAVEMLSFLEERAGNSSSALSYYKNAVLLKDSVFTLEKTKQLDEIQTRYETEKKDFEINQLNQEHEINALRMKQQEAALLNSMLDASMRRNENTLLKRNREIDALQLEKTRKQLQERNLEARAGLIELENTRKEKELREQELYFQKFLRNSIIALSILLGILGIILFNRFQLKKKLEQHAGLLLERKRISADLHDDIGATLSCFSVYSEIIRKQAEQKNYERVLEIVNQVGEDARTMIESMSDIVWAINPGNDSMEKILQRMRNYASTMLGGRRIKISFYLDDALSNVQLSMEKRRNLLLVFKEAVNNIAKYAKAKNTIIELKKVKDSIMLKIKDDGTGFNEQELEHINGLRNMKERAAEIHGDIKIETTPLSGTELNLIFPV